MRSKLAQSYPKKGKDGFTLIEIFTALAIMLIITGVTVISVTGLFKPTGKVAYAVSKEEIGTAITAYSSNSKSPGEIPTLDGKYSILGTNYSVVDFSLLFNSGVMKQMPIGLYLSDFVGYDNCNGDVGLGYKEANHYVWLVDSVGNIYSVCQGTGCASYNVSGYQGVWP